MSRWYKVMVVPKIFRFFAVHTLTRALFILTIVISFFNIWDVHQVNAACTISGKVYVDYNNSSTQDANEPGQGNITVNAYADPDGDGISQIVDTAVTQATDVFATDGTYLLSGPGLTGLPDGQVRVEFSGIPTYL